MNNMLNTIVPKSDQLNADDLIGSRVLTIKITDVSVLVSGEQPVTINYEGGAGKPFKPCKSMRRVLVTVWGGDGNQYIGRRMTLYRDEKVKWAGAEVGGLRISHVSHITEPVTIALTASKGNRKPFVVHPLKDEPTQAKPPTAAELTATYEAAKTRPEFDAAEVLRKQIWKSLDKPTASKLKAASDAASKRIAETPAEDKPADKGDAYEDDGTGEPRNLPGFGDKAGMPVH